MMYQAARNDPNHAQQHQHRPLLRPRLVEGMEGVIFAALHAYNHSKMIHAYGGFEESEMAGREQGTRRKGRTDERRDGDR